MLKIIYSRIFLIFFFSILSGCFKSQPILVSDKYAFSELQNESKTALFKKLNRQTRLEKGALIHDVKMFTTFRKDSFAHAFLFNNNNARISFYTTNFSKLLFYVVVNDDRTLVSDVSRKEALIKNNHSGNFYIPQLPSFHLSINLYRDIILGQIPIEIYNDERAKLFFDKRGIQNRNRYILEGETSEGDYHALLRYSKTGYYIEKLLLIPEDSKNTIEISYSYNEEKSLPEKILISIPDSSIELVFEISRYTNELEGDIENLFSTEPPKGYDVYTQPD